MSGPKLGARPLNPVVEPPAAQPEAEPTTEQVAESQQWDADLQAGIDHLKSLDPTDPHFAPDMLDALDILDNHTGGAVNRIAELRDRVQKGVSAKARNALAEHISWATESFPPGVDRTMAALHGFNLHLDNLDPVEDAELIAFGRQALGIPQDET
jgi:hypothetical protein